MKSSVAAAFGLVIVVLALAMIMWVPIAHPATVCGSWNSVSTPNSSTGFNAFDAVSAVSSTDVWAVGYYDADPDPIFVLDQSLTAHWNGTSWSAVPSPNVGPSGTVLTDVVALASNDVWAVGYSSTYGTPQTLALHWNGSSWSVVPSPVVTGGSSFESIAAISANDIWAVGLRAGGLPPFTTTTGTMAAHWNGSNWTEVPSPNIGNRWNDVTAVAAISTNDVWAVGSWRHIGGAYQTLTLHWNGSSWSIVSSPNPSIENQLVAVAGTGSNDVWATGSGNDGITTSLLFFHWNGSSWTPVASPGGGDGLVTLAPDDAWSVGGNIAHWDGLRWSLVPNPTLAGSSGIGMLSIAAVSSCEAWAVGDAQLAEGTRTFAARLTAGGGTINQPPVVTVSATPATGVAPLTVQLSSAGSFDPDGAIVSYLWNFGDSTYPPEQTSANPVHTYIQSGPLTYHATLVVIDDRGGQATASVQINITGPQPTVHAESQTVTRVGTTDGRLRAEDVVQVTEGNGSPVPGASVSVQYTGPTTGSATGTTGADGRVTLASTAILPASTLWCFTVISISAAGYTYLPSANVVTTRCEIPTGPKATVTVHTDPVFQSSGAGAHISFTLDEATLVEARVFDATGRQVRSLLHREWMESGGHAIEWDGRDENGRALPSGVYYAQLDIAGRRSVGRIGILR